MCRRARAALAACPLRACAVRATAAARARHDALGAALHARTSPPPAARARRELARDGHNDKQINTTKQTDGAAGFTACITACDAEREAFDRREEDQGKKVEGLSARRADHKEHQRIEKHALDLLSKKRSGFRVDTHRKIQRGFSEEYDRIKVVAREHYDYQPGSHQLISLKSRDPLQVQHVSQDEVLKDFVLL